MNRRNFIIELENEPYPNDSILNTPHAKRRKINNNWNMDYLELDENDENLDENMDENMNDYEHQNQNIELFRNDYENDDNFNQILRENYSNLDKTSLSCCFLMQNQQMHNYFFSSHIFQVLWIIALN